MIHVTYDDACKIYTVTALKIEWLKFYTLIEN